MIRELYYRIFNPPVNRQWAEEMAETNWKRASLHELIGALGRLPTREEWHDFLDKGGAEHGN